MRLDQIEQARVDNGPAAAGAAGRTAVLVLGMHRSGTSALTRVFGILGCDLPQTVLPPSRSNPQGFWESRAVMELNDRRGGSGNLNRVLSGRSA